MPQRRFLHEGAASLFHAQEALIAEYLDGASHRMAMDAQLLRQLGFRRELISRGEATGPDVTLDDTQNLTPERQGTVRP